jgi:hypothetical protein
VGGCDRRTVPGKSSPVCISRTSRGGAQLPNCSPKTRRERSRRTSRNCESVAVLGALPGGLPRPALPTFDLLRQLIPLALILTLVIMMQTATVTYSFRNSAEPEPDIDPAVTKAIFGRPSSASFGLDRASDPPRLSPRPAVACPSEIENWERRLGYELPRLENLN